MKKILFKNDWLSLREYRDDNSNVKYTYIQGERGVGDCVAILPFKIVDGAPQFLVRADWIPCWGMDQEINYPKFMVAITGGIEGLGPTKTVLKELKEETGFDAYAEELVELGACYISKVSAAFAYLYTVNLTDREQGERPPSDDFLENFGEATWVGQKELIMQGADPLLHAMLARILETFLAVEEPEPSQEEQVTTEQ